MENNIKFRNHASVIVENSLKAIGTVFFIFILNFISDLGVEEIEIEDILLLVGVLLFFLAIILGYQALVWAKTYICIQDNMLIVERNTLNKKKNTIGLKNISNVNLEQNLFEMLIGTCKVKLDTNSLSTADQTDVNIVLKKRDAEMFRAMVLGAENDEKSTEKDQLEAKKEHISDIGDIVLHGLFSIRISSVIILIGIVGIQTAMIMDLGTDNLGESIVEIIVNMFAAFWLAVGILWSMIKEFIRYIGFQIERKEDKVFLSYGLFKKVAYSVPVDKINGIRLTQTPIARMGKRYMVEIINVGMDDGENEVNTFFLPYAKKTKIAEQLQLILPEFEGCMDIREEKQHPCIWLLWGTNVLFFLAVVAVGCGVAAEFAPDFIELVLWGAAIIGVWRVIVKFASFLTRGVAVNERFLKIVNGGFSKKMLFVKYDKIQYVTGKQCVVAKHFGIQKGTIFVLASMKNRVHELPYFKEQDMEKLKSYL